MTGWTCPRCDRHFGTKRGHVCESGMPVDVWLATLPEGQCRAAEAVLAIAHAHEGVIVEAVHVGLFLKRERTIVELRPMKRWLQLSFISTAAIASERISRTIALPTGTAYFVRLVDDTNVDAELRRWLDSVLRAPKPPTPTRRRAAKR